ncbi:MAS protein, partial [Dromas ardeola]|nr:MAS protein [Dromas ardeola]
ETNTTVLSLKSMDSGYPDSQPVTKYCCIKQNYSAMIIVAVFIGFCLCGLVGNTVVIRFLGFQMKKNPFTVYVLNLAIADFSLLLFLLVTLTLHIISTVYNSFLFEHYLSYYTLMVLFLFCYYAGMYLLTAMSMERCASVL